MLGTLLSAGLSFLGGKDTNKEAKKASARQMAFQKESAQHSYQWATNDMKKAGINPMLAYQQGGSSALSGSNYKPQNAIGQGVNSALAARRLSADLDNLAQTNLKIQSDTNLNKAMEKTAVADAALKATTAQQVAAQTKIIQSNLQRASTRSDADKTLVGKGTNYLGRWLQNLGITNPQNSKSIPGRY